MYLFLQVANYLGIVIPIGISATATTLMCLVSAKTAGDPYPVRESMIADGIGTMIASFFGSPFGTVIYIGHPAYKKSGARAGYSLANGVLFLIFSWFGILALMQVRASCQCCTSHVRMCAVSFSSRHHFVSYRFLSLLSIPLRYAGSSQPGYHWTHRFVRRIDDQ